MSLLPLCCQALVSQVLERVDGPAGADGEGSDWEIVDRQDSVTEPGILQSFMQMAELIYFTQAKPAIGVQLAACNAVHPLCA